MTELYGFIEKSQDIKKGYSLLLPFLRLNYG